MGSQLEAVKVQASRGVTRCITRRMTQDEIDKVMEEADKAACSYDLRAMSNGHDEDVEEQEDEEEEMEEEQVKEKPEEEGGQEEQVKEKLNKLICWKCRSNLQYNEYTCCICNLKYHLKCLDPDERGAVKNRW